MNAPRVPLEGGDVAPAAAQAPRASNVPMSERPAFRPVAPCTRVGIGLAGAAAALTAGAFLFGPFSDLSAMQLAAGPKARDAADGRTAQIVLARTGRAWGDAAVRRELASASAPLQGLRTAEADVP